MTNIFSILHVKSPHKLLLHAQQIGTFDSFLDRLNFIAASLALLVDLCSVCSACSRQFKSLSIFVSEVDLEDVLDLIGIGSEIWLEHLIYWVNIVKFDLQVILRLCLSD